MDLQAARDGLRACFRDLDTVREKLHASREKAAAAKERVLISKEKLQASREHFRVMNERFSIITGKVQQKLDELGTNTKHLDDLLASTNLATGFLGVQETLVRGEQGRGAETQRARVADCIASFTRRERQVARLLLSGRTSRLIAAALGLSIRTVEGYRSRLLEKMHVASTTELVAVLLRSGVTSLG